MRLHNTLSGKVEDFESDGRVTLYVCGVTPYDTTHVGHARTYLLFDVLIRQLMHQGWQTNYVQNITDVDDSIIARAAQTGETYQALGDHFTGIYMDDISALGMIPAQAYPRATGAIPEMQEVIRRLLATGHAYRVGGDVYFNLDGIEDFGRLSRLDRADMLQIEAEQDGSTVGDGRKKDPLDFLLWRSSRPGEPSWGSPWGEGRPGWHLECSTLAMRHLGPSVDIHGGGADLVYPHHEAEIVQSQAVTGIKPFARTWVHVAMALLGGRKMSKSDGNMVFVRDLLETRSPDALRLYLLATHYREPLDFKSEGLERYSEVSLRLSKVAHASASLR
ncbi:MAG: cysteine--tRNA ligase, partial [Actinomycetota bacterium]|nr:cysteine--tRNA ligase [Actinomycetota bacterium]